MVDLVKLRKKAKEKNRGKETFYFCDGPPYATGQIHPGTGWNKTIKDAVCRYQRMSGKDVRVQAGYDTHGLPIEVKVEQELKFTNKGDIVMTLDGAAAPQAVANFVTLSCIWNVW